MDLTKIHDSYTTPRGTIKAIALFNAAKGSSDSDIAAFAGKTLPTLQVHRQMLSTLQSSSQSFPYNSKVAALGNQKETH